MEAATHLDPEPAAALTTLPDMHLADLAGTTALARTRRPPRVPNLTRSPSRRRGSHGRGLPPPTSSPDPGPGRYTPSGRARLTSTVLMPPWGGVVMGDVDMTTASVVGRGPGRRHRGSVGRGSVAEHPCAAALHDCAAVRCWNGRASALGLNPGRIVVYGMSVGGRTLHMRDNAGPPIRFPLLDAPPLNDRPNTLHAGLRRRPVVNRSIAPISRQHYLSPCDAEVSPNMTRASTRPTPRNWPAHEGNHERGRLPGLSRQQVRCREPAADSPAYPQCSATELEDLVAVGGPTVKEMDEQDASLLVATLVCGG
jgi:alpha/beta hydrolase fold